MTTQEPPAPNADWLMVRRNAVNVICLTAAGLCALVALGALSLVLGYLVLNGFKALHLSTLVLGQMPQGEPGGGLRDGIVGTLMLLAVAAVIGIPFGILGGVFQIESKGKFAWTVRFFTDVLNSIPSIVIGLFVYTLVVLPIAAAHPGDGYSALAGGIALGVIMVPTVMRTTEEILRLVPSSLREASLGLGATQWRTMFSVILPAARTGILTGVMLAMARVAGETAPLLFTAFGSNMFSVKLDKPIDALPIDIYNDATSPYNYLHAQALAGAIILISMILLMSLITRYALGNKVLEQK
jgi:phosphate transport system permease protein